MGHTIDYNGIKILDEIKKDPTNRQEKANFEYPNQFAN